MNSPSSSSSSPSSPSKFLDLGSVFGQKEVKKILVLFLGLTASCLLLYKTAYPLPQELDVNNLTSSRPLLDHSSSSSPQRRPKSISFREVLENASTENRTVIVTTLNQAWAEPNSLFDLFLESFRIGQGTQKLLQHVVVVCLDPKAFDRCSQLHPNCYYLETSGTDFSGEKLFATPDYLKMMWRRIELLTQVLEMGFNFIFTVLVQNLSFVQPASPPLVISSSSKKEENSVKKRPASPPVVVASSESDIKKQPGRAKKNIVMDEAFDSWNHLIENPKDWWDHRENKANGLVKPRHPDFKSKDSSLSLWLNKAPAWVLPKLEGLEFDVLVPKGRGVKQLKGEESWKELVENPDKWWDNRIDKRNAKAPDFKHKETGEALWLNESPTWVLSKLPPVKKRQEITVS